MKVKLFFFLTYKVMGLYGIIFEETNAFRNEQMLVGSSINTARGSAKGLCLMHTITSILSLLHKVIKSSQTAPLNFCEKMLSRVLMVKNATQF